MTTTLSIFAILVALLGACNKQSFKSEVPEFQAGTSDQEPKPEKTVDTIKPNCSQSNGTITESKLLSKGFSTDGKPQTLSYELSLVSCEDGKKLPIKDLAIAFDFVLAVNFDDEHPITYEIKNSSNKLIEKGQFIEKEGEDLFGVKKEWIIWLTKAVGFETAESKILFDVHIGGFLIVTYGETKVDTYLKIGDSEPVLTQVNIVK